MRSESEVMVTRLDLPGPGTTITYQDIRMSPQLILNTQYWMLWLDAAAASEQWHCQWLSSAVTVTLAVALAGCHGGHCSSLQAWALGDSDYAAEPERRAAARVSTTRKGQEVMLNSCLRSPTISTLFQRFSEGVSKCCFRTRTCHNSAYFKWVLRNFFAYFGYFCIFCAYSAYFSVYFAYYFCAFCVQKGGVHILRIFCILVAHSCA